MSFANKGRMPCFGRRLQGSTHPPSASMGLKKKSWKEYRRRYYLANFST